MLRMKDKLTITTNNGKQLEVAVNTKIIDKSLSFIYKVIMSKKYNSTLAEENHIDNLCIEIINKYMKTSHSHLLSKTLEIIINLINKQINLQRTSLLYRME